MNKEYRIRDIELIAELESVREQIQELDVAVERVILALVEGGRSI